MKLKANPYVWQRVDLSLFTGREKLADEIISDAKSGKSGAVLGGRKFGKTVLLRYIEAKLRADCKEAGALFVPIYIDVLGLPRPLNAKSLYVTIISTIEDELRQRGLLLPQAYTSGLYLFDARPFEPNTVFKELYLGLLHLCSRTRPLHAIALIDEVEPIATSEWADGFFANWRNILSNSPELSGKISVVFSGAKEMSVLSRDIGSPLANVLTIRELELLSWAASRRLIHGPTLNQLSHGLGREIFTLSGGHPFLIQYLMQSICEDDLGNASNSLGRAVQSLYSSNKHFFSGMWFSHFDSDDREVYLYLSDRKKVPKREVIEFIGDSVANRVLASLSQAGVCRRLGRSERYRVQGELFLRWFRTEASIVSGRSECDRRIYDTIRSLDLKIASKYVAAWSIQTAKLPNYSGAVSEMRDTVTLVLHALAPDATVMSEVEYVPQSDGKGGTLTKPTRAQRVSFICRKKQVDEKKLSNEIETLNAHIVSLSKLVSDSYQVASGKTHVVADEGASWRCLKQLDSVLAQLL
jgi:hypothetical protein